MKALIVLLLFLSFLFSQGTIKGTITDKGTGEPIVAANVFIEGSGLGASTDQLGQYIVELVPTGEVDLIISAIGYATFQRSLEVRQGTVVVDAELNIKPIELPIVTISSERTDLIGGVENLNRIPGSAHLISRRELVRHGYTDVNRLLQNVPGINLQEEDGFGLRPNIGMRGGAVERSQKIALMEDGILIAPAPYAAPSAYYFPTIGRMEKVEIRKGSSQIKYGPNTTNGALNLISTTIPSELTARARILFGAFDSSRMHTYVGNSGENLGWITEAHFYASGGFKLLDNGGNTGFRKKDLMTKIRYNSSEKAALFQSLELKLGIADEISHETYLGLADRDFRIQPYRRYLASQNDQMDAEHFQSHVRYFIRPWNNLDITTTVYYNKFFRNWYKLDKVNGEKIAAILSDPGNYAEAFRMLFVDNSETDQYQVKANKRNYLSKGVQSIIHFSPSLAGKKHVIEFGFRYHEDEEDRFQHMDYYQMINKELRITGEGSPGSKDNRIGSATAHSLFIQDQFNSGNLSIVTGMRYESISLTREDYQKDDPDRKGSSEVYRNQVVVLIPGIGLNFHLRPDLILFSGLHKGFSPPTPGKDSGVRAEESINSEIGFRLRGHPFRINAALFLNSYDNMLGSDVNAIGGEGTGDQFNAGEVRVAGLEVDSRYLFKTERVSYLVEFGYTFTYAKFENDFESKFKPWGKVQKGDRVPYIPDQQLSVGLEVQSEKWRAGLNTKYVSAMRTKAGPDKLIPTEATDSHFIIDVSSDVLLNNITALFITVRNILDQTYIVSRRPAGIRPGMPRMVMAGVKLDF